MKTTEEAAEDLACKILKIYLGNPELYQADYESLTKEIKSVIEEQIAADRKRLNICELNELKDKLPALHTHISALSTKNQDLREQMEKAKKLLCTWPNCNAAVV